MNAIRVFVSSIEKEFAGERAAVHAHATPPQIPGAKARPESLPEFEAEDIP